VKKLFVFDFDGTLADSKREVEVIASKLAGEEGLNLDFEGAEGKSYKELLQRIPKWKIPLYVSKIKKELEASTPPLFEGMGEVVRTASLEGRTALLTSSPGRLVHSFLERHRLAFDKVVTDCSLNKSKHLKRLLSSEKVEPGEALLIGDDERDVEAARGNGVEVVVVSWGYRDESFLESLNPDFLARSPEELLSIIKEA